MNKEVFIKTFGCQMNEHDSSRLKDLLAEQGYTFCAAPEQADIVIFNTCSIRKHAEDRVYGKVGTLGKLKAKKPGLVIGIVGCMAEAERGDIFNRTPIVDFLCGPADLDSVPDILNKIKSGAGRIMYLEGYKSKIIPAFSKDRLASESVFVKIMEGCDNFCSYCIVPYVRGRERSRPSKDILEEIKQLIKSGVKEITLLGQNVNSYGKGLRENINFVRLLRKIDKIAGSVRINFFTSHPKDAGPELFRAMRDLKSVSKIMHLPIQSGSDKILRRMNRKYTVAKYRRLVECYRKIVKGGNVSSDIIVGFPGETEKDFEDTFNIVKELQFDAAYIFKYSPRPITKAAKLKDDVSLEEKERRHALLLGLQRDILACKKHK
jgi:tRNA-2-methylthio-N6-dimethylallyladenosine synthase